jgi:hypothetical protein
MKSKAFTLLFLVVLLVGCAGQPQPTETLLMHRGLAPRAYLPIIANSTPKLAGVEWETNAITAQAWHVDGSPFRVSCRWAEIETAPFVYNWDICDGKVGSDKPYILTIKMSPAWALLPGWEMCKLPLRDTWQYLGEVVKAAHERYDPKYIEIWNEPDAGGNPFPAPTHYGCMGSGAGALYGELITYIAEQAPDVPLAAGALGDVRSEFLPDMLTTATGFEALTFHCYAYYHNALYSTCLDDYNYARQFWHLVIISETGVFYQAGNDDDYYAAQVDFFGHLAENMDTPWFWFTLLHNGWPAPYSTDMLGPQNTPRPVYDAYLQYYGEK